MYSLSNTLSEICKDIFENIKTEHTSNYKYNVNLSEIEKQNIGNTISVMPIASTIFDVDYNINRFRIDIEIQVFQKYVNQDQSIDEWTRWQEYTKVLDAFLNNYGKIKNIHITDIGDMGTIEHVVGQGRLFAFTVSGDAYMLDENNNPLNGGKGEC